jgi:6-phospho-beta-glucosidase
MTQPPSSHLTITILGGGSVFSPGFFGVMARSPDLFSSAEIRLMDPDLKNADINRRFGEQLFRANGVPAAFSVTDDLDRALDGADFVVTSFRIGGAEGLRLDQAIPPRFGMYGEETAGPGGMFMAMRTVPVVLDAAQRMERLCPDAWLINYANPTQMIADAVLRATKTKVVSLCDGYCNAQADVGAYFGIPMAEIDTLHAGLNHFAWCYRADHNGRDLLEALRQPDPGSFKANLEKQSEAYRFHLELGHEIFMLYGLYPCPLGHMDCVFYHDLFLERQQAAPAKRGASASSEQHRAERRARVRKLADAFDAQAAAEVVRLHGGAHAELAIGVLKALAADTGELLPVNVRNNGAVSGLSDDTVVEVYSRVGRTGCLPRPVDPFPKSITAWLQTLAAYQELVVSGILEKRPDTLIEALSVHPFCPSIRRARECFTAMLDAERHLLPPYWPVAGVRCPHSTESCRG